MKKQHCCQPLHEIKTISATNSVTGAMLTFVGQFAIMGTLICVFSIMKVKISLDVMSHTIYARS